MYPQIVRTIDSRGTDREAHRDAHNLEKRRKNSLRNWAPLLLVFGVVWPMAATTLARMDLGQLTARAAAVVRARCIGVVPRMDRSGISTLTTFEYAELWKGRAPQHFAVRLPGGMMGGRREMVEGAPRFSVGEEAVLFLEPLGAGEWTIAGWAQGTYRIRRDARTGIERAFSDAAGMQLLEVTAGTFRTNTGGSTEISQLRSIVLRLVQGGTR